jgi:hypothetical protein
MKIGNVVIHKPSGELCVIIKTDVDVNQDDVCLVLHPDGESAWQYIYDLELVHEGR